jgi:NitT/TauT family transport system substrate-binding protein
MAEAALYVALERGYFAQAGLAVDLVTGATGAEAMQFLASGHTEVSFSGVTAALFNSLGRGIPVKLVAPADAYYPGASSVYLMVRQDLFDRGEIQDYADLAGRRVAIPVRGAFIHYLVALALRRAGLGIGAVELVELPFGDTNAALASGAVGIAVQTDPLATLAAEQRIAAKWRSAGDVRPGLIGAGFFYAPDLVERRRDVGERWIVAYLQGVREYNTLVQQPEGRDEVAAILARYTPVADTGLYQRMALPYFRPNGDIDQGALQDQLQWYVEQGMVPATVALSLALDTRFAEAAVRRLGRASEPIAQAPPHASA